MLLFIFLAMLTMTTNGQIPRVIPNSPFCDNKADLGERKDCSELLGVSCHVKEYRHDAECGNINFSSSLFDEVTTNPVTLDYGDERSLTKVAIKPYIYKARNVPVRNINVTFSDIKFSSLYLRMKIVCVNGTDMTCWKFVSNVSNAKESSILFWDCKWFDATFSKCPIFLEYQALRGNFAEVKNFSFNLPQNEEINSKNPEILVSIEHSMQCVSIHWAASHENISIFRVKLYLLDITKDWLVSNFTTNKTMHKFCDELKHGARYNVSVEGNLYDGWTQPFFCILNTTILYPEDYSLPAISLILFLIVMIFLCVSLVKYYLSKNTVLPDRCVIAYNPLSHRHRRVVDAFVNFLKSYLAVSYFETDHTTNQIAEDWWGKKLSEADLIIVVSNPTQNTNRECPGSVKSPYFAKSHLRDSLQYMVGEKSCRIIRVLLPYCDENNGFYDFLKSCTPCYHILKDRYKLLQAILGPHNVHLPSWIASSHYSNYFREKWTDLESVIRNYNHSADEQMTNSVYESQVSLTDYVSSDGSEYDKKEGLEGIPPDTSDESDESDESDSGKGLHLSR